MSKTLGEEKIPIPSATVAADVSKEAKNSGDTNGTDKDFSEKESSIIALKTKEKEEIAITIKDISQDYPAKDAEVQEEKESKKIERENLKEMEDTNTVAKTVQPIAVEEMFQEEKVEPVESLKDISDHLNTAAKSLMQKVAEKVEDKIEKSVEKEERKEVTGVEDTFKEEKVKPIESSFEEKVEVTKEEEKVNPIESNLDEKVEVKIEEDKIKPVESSSDEKVDVTKEKEKIKPVESISDEKVNPAESYSDEKVEAATQEEEIKQEVRDLPPDTKEDMEIKSKTKQDDVDGNEKKEIMIEQICIEKTVKPLGSPEKEPIPESLPIESSNEKNLSVPLSGANNKPKEKEATQPSLITEDPGTNSQISEGVTPDEKESFADIAQKIPFADENSDDIIEEVGKAPIVYDDETQVSPENTMIQNEETKEAEEEEKEETQPKNCDSESATDIAQEAEAEAEPCTEEIQEPVEAILDDVEIESVSDNIETGSEQSTTSDTNDSNEKKKISGNKLLLGAILVALIALLIAILSVDMTSISTAIGITKPEPKPIVKPFWKFF